MSMEYRVLNATIDLAASQRTGESIEWLPFNAILEAFRSICHQLKVTGDLERRCYRLLLLMDADTGSLNEEGYPPTWWEKVHQLSKYLTKLDNHQLQVSSQGDNISKSEKKSRHSVSPFATMPLMNSKLHPSSFTSSRLQSPVQPVTLRYAQSDDARQFRQPPASVSMMSPSLLNEGAELSMILNHHIPTRYTPTKPSSNSSSSSSQAQNMETSFYRTPQSVLDSNTLVNRAGTNYALDDLAEKISSVEKEAKNTRNLIAQIAYRKAHSQSPIKQPENNGARSTQESTNRRIRFDEVVDVDTLSHQTETKPHTDDMSTIIGASHRFDHGIDSPAFSLAQTPATKEKLVHDDTNTTNPFSALLSPGDQVQEFSKALQSSAVMQKYLQRAGGAATSSSSGAGVAKEGLLQKMNTSPQTSSVSNKNRKFRLDDLRSPDEAESILKENRVSVDKKLGSFSPNKNNPVTERSKSPRFTDSKRLTPRNDENSSFKQFSRNDESEPDPVQTLPNAEQMIAQLSDEMMSTSSLLGFFHSGSDPSDMSMNATPEATSAAVSAMKLLVLFQQWILKYSSHASSATMASTLSPASMLFDKLEMKFPEYKSFVSEANDDTEDDEYYNSELREHGHRLYHSPYDQHERIIPLMFYHHLTMLSDFAHVSNLFGLEQWLREKMRVFVLRQAKRVLFQRWSAYVGVNHQSRTHHDKFRKRKGLNLFLENVVRARLRRKNAMMVFAYRRVQSFQEGKVRHSLGSIFRNLKRSSNNHDLGEENEEEETMYSFGLFSSPHDKLSFSNQNNTNPPGQDFSTLVSIRYLLHSTQYALQMLHKPDAPAAFTSPTRATFSAKNSKALTEETTNPTIMKLAAHGKMFVGPEASASVGHLHQRAYEQAQDLIARFFAFRRFYRRTLYHKRFLFVHKRFHLKRCAFDAFRAWRKAFHHRLDFHEQMAPKIMLASDKILQFRVHRAFRLLMDNIDKQKYIRDYLASFRAKIEKKDVFVKALHLFKHPFVVRMFVQWKENYVTHNVPVVLLRQAEREYLKRAQRRCIHRLLFWSQSRRKQRGKVIQHHAGLSNLYDHLIQSPHFNENLQKKKEFSSFRSKKLSQSSKVIDGEERPMELTLTKLEKELIWQAYDQQRYLTRWWCLARRTRVFSSLLDLKFHHTYTHVTAAASAASGTAQYEQSLLRQRFHWLVKKLSTSIPISVARRLYLWRIKRSEQLYLGYEKANDAALNSTIKMPQAALTTLVGPLPAEKHYQLIFFEHPQPSSKKNDISMKLKKQGKSTLSLTYRDLAALHMRLIDFPTSSFSTTRLLHDDSFVFLSDSATLDFFAPPTPCESSSSVPNTNNNPTNSNSTYRTFRHRFSDASQPHSTYLAENDDDTLHEYPSEMDTETGPPPTKSPKQNAMKNASPAHRRRYFSGMDDHEDSADPRDATKTQRVAAGIMKKSSSRLPKMTPMVLLQRAGERLERLHRIAQSGHRHQASSTSQQHPNKIPPKTQMAGQYLAQTDTQEMLQQQQYLHTSFNTTMALKRALHHWLTNHRHQQQIYQQYDHLHSQILRSQKRRFLNLWHATWKHVTFWRRQRRHMYLTRLEKCTVNQIRAKRAQEKVKKYLTRRALIVFQKFAHLRRYLREFESARLYNRFLEQLTALYVSSGTSSDSSGFPYSTQSATRQLAAPSESVKRRRQSFWHFLTHSEALVPYPLRHFLNQHPSFRFPLPPPPTDNIQTYVQQHNRYSTQYPFPVYPVNIFQNLKQQQQQLHHSLNHYTNTPTNGNNSNAQVPSSTPSSFFYNDHIHTSIHKTTAAMRRMSQSAALTAKDQSQTLSLSHPMQHDPVSGGYRAVYHPQIPLIIHYLAQVIPLFHLLHRTVGRWTDFTYHIQKLRHIRRVLYQKHITIAFRKFRRHQRDGMLRDRVYLLRFKRYMVAWRGAFLRRHMQQQSYLKRSLQHWRFFYQRTIIVRVWERAWGYRMRSAWQKLQEYSMIMTGKINAVNKFVRNHRLKNWFATWKSHQKSQSHFNRGQQHRFFQHFRLWILKRKHFLHHLENTHARRHHVRAMSVVTWQRNVHSQSKQRRWQLLGDWWHRQMLKQTGYLALRRFCHRKILKNASKGHDLGQMKNTDMILQEDTYNMRYKLGDHRLQMARHWQTRQVPLMVYQYRLSDRFQERYRHEGSVMLYPYNPEFLQQSLHSDQKLQHFLDHFQEQTKPPVLSPATQFKQDFPHQLNERSGYQKTDLLQKYEARLPAGSRYSLQQDHHSPMRQEEIQSNYFDDEENQEDEDDADKHENNVPVGRDQYQSDMFERGGVNYADDGEEEQSDEYDGPLRIDTGVTPKGNRSNLFISPQHAQESPHPAHRPSPLTPAQRALLASSSSSPHLSRANDTNNINVNDQSSTNYRIPTSQRHTPLASSVSKHHAQTAPPVTMDDMITFGLSPGPSLSHIRVSKSPAHHVSTSNYHSPGNYSDNRGPITPHSAKSAAVHTNRYTPQPRSQTSHYFFPTELPPPHTHSHVTSSQEDHHSPTISSLQSPLSNSSPKKLRTPSHQQQYSSIATVNMPESRGRSPFLEDHNRTRSASAPPSTTNTATRINSSRHGPQIQADTMFSPLSSPSFTLPAHVQYQQRSGGLKMKPSELATSVSSSAVSSPVSSSGGRLRRSHSSPAIYTPTSTSNRTSDPLAKWRVAPLSSHSNASSPSHPSYYPSEPFHSSANQNSPSHHRQTTPLPPAPISVAKRSSSTFALSSSVLRSPMHKPVRPSTSTSSMSSVHDTTPMFRTIQSPRSAMQRSPVAVSHGIAAPLPSTSSHHHLQQQQQPPLSNTSIGRFSPTPSVSSPTVAGVSSSYSPLPSQLTHTSSVSRAAWRQEDDERLCHRQVLFLSLRRWVRHYLRRRHHPRVAFFHHSSAACLRLLRHWCRMHVHRRQQRALVCRAGQLACLRRWVHRVNTRRSLRVLTHDWTVSYAALRTMKRLLQRWRGVSAQHSLQATSRRHSDTYRTRRVLYLAWGDWRRMSLLDRPTSETGGDAEEKEQQGEVGKTPQKRKKDDKKEDKRGDKMETSSKQHVQNNRSFALFHKVKTLLHQHV